MELTRRESWSRVAYNDQTIGVQWDVCDLDFILDQYKKINMCRGKARKPEKLRLIAELEQITQRGYNDQTIYDDTAKKTRKPLDIVIKQDRMTLGGMSRSADLITGESQEYFRYFMVGRGTKAPDVSDWKLEDEVARSDTGGSDSFLGFRSGNGTTISHGAVFMPGVETADIYENAPVDTAEFDEYQVILARTVFPAGNPIHHVAGLDFFTSTHKVEQIAGI
jgi:hypothetical protein